jgi:transporter family-2 protein
MAVQGTLNAALGKVIGIWESTFIVHAVGTAVVILLLFVFKLGNGNFGLMNQAPWYTYLGGLLNVLIIFGVVFSIPKVGVGNATTMIVVLQILTAVAIDHFGVFGMEKIPCKWWDVIGIIMLGAGAKLLLR